MALRMAQFNGSVALVALRIPRGIKEGVDASFVRSSAPADLRVLTALLLTELTQGLQGPFFGSRPIGSFNPP